MLTCHGCKAVFSEPVTSPPHRYGVMSKECWHAFNELLAYEANLGYPEERHLTVNAYLVQHPQNIPLQTKLGIDESAINASIKSVGRHLIGLYCSLEQKIALKDISRIMSEVIRQKKTNRELTPPKQLGTITIADFSQEFTQEEYQTFANKWAQSMWHAWSSEHDTIRSWFLKCKLT